MAPPSARKPVPPRVPQVHVRFVVTHADASLQHRDRARDVVVAVVPGALGEQPARVGRGALAPLLGEERVPTSAPHGSGDAFVVDSPTSTSPARESPPSSTPIASSCSDVHPLRSSMNTRK